jgi:hypothetical protein
MAYLINKDAVAVGVAYGYWGAYDPAAPLELPADTVPFGGDWPTGWHGFGATNEGIRLSMEPDVETITIEESTTPALVVPNTVDITIEADLAEDTLENMLLGFGGGGSIATTAPGPGTVGIKRLNLANTVKVLSAALEMQTTAGYWRRIRVPRNNATGRTEIAFRRAAANRAYGVSFASLSDPSEIDVIEMSAPAV